MDIFKLRNELTNPFAEHELNKNTFETLTGKRNPYYQGNNTRQYAYCPSCNNPIQIVGLYKRDKEMRGGGRTLKPYGKHAGKDIPQIGQFNFDAYVNCPLKSSKESKGIKRKIPSDDQRVREVLTFIRNNYDLITAQLEIDSGLKVTKKNARIMLQRFLDNEGWNYYNTCIENLPWTFAEAFGTGSMYMQLVAIDSHLYEALLNLPSVRIEGYDEQYVQVYGNQQYLNLNFSWMRRSWFREDRQNFQTITFALFSMENNNPNYIYERVIVCDTVAFMERSKEDREKDKGMLYIASEELKARNK